MSSRPPFCLLLYTELGKVTLKGNGDEALSDESPKSNGDEAFNDDFL
jgi:hypothetical protein